MAAQLDYLRDEAARRHATQPPPRSAEEVLQRALDARGGAAAAARIRSIHCKGTIDFAWASRGNFELFAARPGQDRIILDFGGGGRWESGCDGEAAWEIPVGKAAEMQSGAKLQEARDAAAWFAWYDDPGAYRSVTFAGEGCFEGARCYELKLVTKSGLEATHFYNVTNFLLAGTVNRVTVETNSLQHKIKFTDYAMFAGFWFPTRIRTWTDESDCLIGLRSVEVNGVTNTVFNRPAAPAPAKAETKVCDAPARLSDAEIQTILADCIDSDKLGVGLAVGLVDAQSSRVFCCGKLDNGDSPAVNGDTLFEIGSITKLFTRLLLHDMVARGEMCLDDPVQKYLPPSVRMPTRHGRQITLWDLTTHTSGLPREMASPYTVKRLYVFLARHRLRRAPGAEFEYSNVGMALLGHVIALKAGQDYETLVRERICRPLHMDSTFVRLTPAMEKRRATGHAPANKTRSYMGLEELPGGGALFSSANDMLKFASARLGLTPSPLTPLMKTTDVGHNGGTYGFSTSLTLEVKQQRALVVLSNCREPEVVPHLLPLLNNQSPRPPGTVAVAAGVADEYLGQYYVRGQRVRTVRREGMRLLLQQVGEPSCELFPQSETNFCNQLFDCRAAFVRDTATGRAKELLLGDPANPCWRGVRLPGEVLAPSTTPLTDADCRPRPDSDLQGVWEATLRLWYFPFVSVHARLRITEPSPGAFRAEGDSPDDGVYSVPVGIVYRQPSVDVMLLSEDGSFQGEVNGAHNKITGYWKQAGYKVRVTLHRVQPPRAMLGAMSSAR